MGFSIVHDSPQTIWVPVLPGSTVYTGSIVQVDSATPLDGVIPLDTAGGAGNTTNKDIPLGIVVGNNNVSGSITYSSTYKAEYITEVAAGSVYGSTTKYTGVEGPWAKGDPRAMVEIVVIDPTSVIRGSLFNGAVGTAPSETTVTGATASGLDWDTATNDVATVANFSTVYVRSGDSMGVYRQISSASQTTHTQETAVKGSIAVGDKVCMVNGLNTFGISKMDTDATGLYIDVSAALTSNYFHINVLRLDLSVPGNEYVEFQFIAENFCPTVAA